MISGPSQGAPVTEVGTALESCFSALLRWGSRASVQRRMRPGRIVTSPTDDWLLRRILEVGPVRVSDLAAWQAVDKSTMTTQVGRLERQGLVVRRQGSADRRVVEVRATPRGRRLHERNVTEAREVLEGLVEDWSARDRRELARLLTRLGERLEQG